LKRLGRGAGTPIGLVLRNTPESCAAMLGVVGLDACAVTLNAILPDDKLADDIIATRPPLIVAAKSDWARPALFEAARRIGAAGLCVSFEPGPTVESVPGLEEVTGTDLAPDQADIAILMLTSGTTGKPKRAPLRAATLDGQLVEAAGGQRPEASQERQSSASNTVPMHASIVHIAGAWSLLNAALAGRSIALYDKFSVESWAAAMIEFRPKSAGGPPTALRMILDADLPKDTFSSLVSLGAGTAAVDPAIVDEFMNRYDLPVLTNYGATEFAGGVASWSLRAFRQYWPAKRGAAGRLHRSVEARVVEAESGGVLALGEEGILELKGFQVGDGQSWVRTTDRAILDADHFLWIRGRADNAINRGGFKVHPDEVVAVLETHDAVREAAVVGLADHRLGQIPVAALVLKTGVAAPSDGELADWVRGRLAPYCVPVEFKIVEELPRTPSMKVSAPSVCELFAAR
jgi:long-chain acyl-CoA synthetase